MKVSDIFQSKYLKCSDLDGAELPVVIERWDVTTFKEADGTQKQQPLLFFQGIEKPFGCNVTNARTIEHIVGSEDLDDWVGKELILFPSITTNKAGQPVDCIRIRGPIKKAVARTTAAKPDPRITTGRQPMPGDRGNDEPPPWEPQR